MQTITPEELREALKNQDPAIALIDVREPSEFAMGHIEGAQNIPLDDLAKAAYELNDFDTVYVYCRSGGRSALACQMLEGAGVHAVNVAGGLIAWGRA